MSTEVGGLGVKLVLDESASEGLKRIREGFGHLGEKVHEVQGEVAGMLKQTLAAAAGFQLSGAIDSMKEFGSEAFGIAEESERQIKNLAGVLALTDKQGGSYEEAASQAAELKDQLEGIGIKAGVSADSVIEAFSDIAERSGKSREEVLKLTESMAEASKALPGGIGQMASAYRQLESGIVRPKNALVQMIKQTGVMSGSAKEIAKKLGAQVAGGQLENVTAMADAAISKMQEKMKNAPPTFEGLIQSLKDIRENLMEAFGMPLLQAIVPHLNNLKKYLMENKSKIEEYAKSMAEKVGKWVDVASEKIQEGFKYLETHGKEIQEGLSKGAEALKSAIMFIVEHKELLMTIYGGKMAAGAIGAGIGAGKGALQIGGMLAGGAGGLEAAGIVASAGALGLLAAAIASVGYAAVKANELYNQIQKDNTANEDARIARVKELSAQTRLLTDEENAQVAAMRAEMVAKGENTKAFDEAAGQLRTTAEAQTLHTSEMMKLANASKVGDPTALIDAINTAMKTNDQSTLEYARILIERSETLRTKLGEGSDKISSGVQGMFDKIHLSLRSMMDIEKGADKKGPKPNLVAQFTGPITVKQDFRDQDPDRIAVVFRRDLAKAASAPLSGKTIPAGGTSFSL